MRGQIVGAVEEAASEAIELCRALVRTNTVNPYSGEGNPSTERMGQELLRQALDKIGGESVMFDCPDDVYARCGVRGPEGRNFRDRPNLVSEFVFGNGGKTIILNGHMDTVGIADMSVDPFGAEVRDGRIFGRGACDCKGGLTAGWLALKALRSLDPPPNGRVIFESVIDEECNGSGAGTLACCLRGYRGDAAIVIDGYCDQVTYRCMGVLTAEVTVHGRGGHAASRNVISAIDKAIVVKEAIDQVKRAREARCPNCVLNLGIFHAGVLPAVVPSSARLAFNMQYDLSEAQQAEEKGLGPCGRLAEEELERAVQVRCLSDEWLRDHPPQIRWIKDLVPFETEPDHPLIRLLQQAHLEVVGESLEARSLLAWCDAAWLWRHGRMPVVCFGTARPGRAHTVDEWVAIADILRVAKVVALSICRFFGE